MPDDDNNHSLTYPVSADDARSRAARASVPYHGIGGEFVPLHRDGERDDIDFRRFLFYVFKHRWLICIFLSTGMVIALMVTWVMVPKYRSTVKLEIIAPSAKVLEELEIVGATTTDRGFYTAREKLKSRVLTRRVVLDLGLANKARFLFPSPDFAPSNFFNRAFGRTLSTPLNEVDPEKRVRSAINLVQAGLSVELISKTRLVAVSFSHQDPKYAQIVANQVARSYIDHGIDSTSETSVLARQFIEEQVQEVRAKLQQSEQALVGYARQEGLTLAGDENSLIADNIRQINKAISDAIERRLDYGLFVTEIDQGRGASLPKVLENDGIQELRSKIAALSAKYQQKLSAFRPDFPEMRQLKAQIDELERQITTATAVITQSVRLQHNAAIAREADLRAKLAELETKQAEFQEKNIQYTILKREVASNRSQYDSLIAKRNVVGVGAALETHNAVIVDPAELPRSPYSPHLSLNLAGALCLSSLLAVAFIFMREKLENIFSSPEQIEQELDLPVIGILPKVTEQEIKRLFKNRNSTMSEAVRSLRTSLQFADVEGEPKSLVITSSAPGEGKSTTTANLALEFAALGRNVMLVDADFRKPRLHRLFATDNTMGLSNLLAGASSKENLPELFRRTAVPKLTLMTAGSVSNNSPDLLVSKRMSQFLRFCTQHYDIVIFDSPPIMGLSDPLILSRIVEGTVLIVSADCTRRDSVNEALKRLRAAGGEILGVVLNRFSFSNYAYGDAYSTDIYSYGASEQLLAIRSGTYEKRGNIHSAIRKVRRLLLRVGKVLHYRLNHSA